MNRRWTEYGWILLTIGLTVYGQLILKARIGRFGPMPQELEARVGHLLRLLFDPGIFSGFVAAFLASLAWMTAMTKFQLSEAYPFMSLNFVLVLVASALLLGEQLNIYKVVGVALIVGGTLVVSRSSVQ